MNFLIRVRIWGIIVRSLKDIREKLEKDAGGHKVINIVTVETGISEGGILSKLINDTKSFGNPIIKRQEYNTRDLRKGRK